MKKTKKLKGAKAFGVKMKISKSLGKYPGKSRSPKKLEMANEIIRQLK